MRNTIRRLALVGMLLTLPGCQLTFLSFFVPPTVQVGQVFEVAVQFTNDGQLGSGGCVLQLPLGFTVVGVSGNALAATRDEPALLSIYTAEPGTYLASWSMTGTLLAGMPTHSAFVQAPATPTNGVIKVSLAARSSVGSGWLAVSPSSSSAFSSITAPTHAQGISVVAVPAGPFAEDTIGLNPGLPALSSAVAFADFDGDGNDDLVSDRFARLRTSTGWTQAGTGLSSTGASAARVAAGDFDGDGFADIVHGSGYVWWGDGGSFWSAGPLLWNAFAVATGDINADGRSDIALGDSRGNFRAFFGNANRTFTSASTGLPLLLNVNGGRELQLADVTGDGWLDIVAKEVVWAGDGQGNWTSGSGLNGMFAAGVAVGDLDNDGQPELVYANNTAGMAVMRHLGSNSWAPAPVIGLPTQPAASVAILDYDRDGWLDLAIGWLYGTNGVQLFRNLGAFSFALVANSGLPRLSASEAIDLDVGDINGDSWPDLAAATPDRLVVWQNWLGGLSTFGSPCAASLPAPPTITGTSAPTIGNPTFALRVAGGPVGAIGVSWLGVSARTWNGVPVLPLDLALIGAPGCTMWVGPEFLDFGVFSAAGDLTRPVPIPPNPTLLSLTFFGQGAAVVGGSSPALAVTSGLAIRIQ